MAGKRRRTTTTKSSSSNNNTATTTTSAAASSSNNNNRSSRENDDRNDDDDEEENASSLSFLYTVLKRLSQLLSTTAAISSSVAAPEVEEEQQKQQENQNQNQNEDDISSTTKPSPSSSKTAIAPADTTTTTTTTTTSKSNSNSNNKEPISSTTKSVSAVALEEMMLPDNMHTSNSTSQRRGKKKKKKGKKALALDFLDRMDKFVENSSAIMQKVTSSGGGGGKKRARVNAQTKSLLDAILCQEEDDDDDGDGDDDDDDDEQEDEGSPTSAETTALSAAAGSGGGGSDVDADNDNDEATVDSVGFWILLSTHILNRLMEYSNNLNNSSASSSSSSNSNDHNAAANDDKDNDKDGILFIIATLSLQLERLLLLPPDYPRIPPPEDGTARGADGGNVVAGSLPVTENEEAADSNTSTKNSSSNSNNNSHNLLVRRKNERRALLDHVTAATTGKTGRHLLGRALLTCTAASLHVLQQQQQQQQQQAPKPEEKSNAKNAGKKKKNTSNHAGNDVSAPHHPSSRLLLSTRTRVAAIMCIDEVIHFWHCTTASRNTTASSGGCGAGAPDHDSVWEYVRNLLEEVLGLQAAFRNTGASCDDGDDADWLKKVCASVSAKCFEQNSPEEVCCVALERFLNGKEQEASVNAGTTTTSSNTTKLPPLPAQETPSIARRISRRKATRSTSSATAVSSIPESSPQSPNDVSEASSANLMTTTTTGTTTWTYPLHAAFATLFFPPTSKAAHESTHGIKLDNRVAMRRWSAVAAVWYCRGELILSQTAKAMLEELDAQETFSGLSTGKAYPPALVVTMVCRLILAINEMGQVCGTRPTAGGVEEYMKAVWPKSQKSRGGSPSKRKKASGQTDANNRLEIGTVAVTVMHKLIAAHGYCLNSLTKAPLQPSSLPPPLMTVINDDDTRDENLRADSLHYSYYPFVHESLDNLIKATASVHSYTLQQKPLPSVSIVGSFTQNAVMQEVQAAYQHRLQCLVGAYVLQQQQQESTNGVIDARLAIVAIESLASSIKQTQNQKEKIKISNVDDLKLNQPLGPPDDDVMATVAVVAGRTQASGRTSSSRSKKAAALQKQQLKEAAVFPGPKMLSFFFRSAVGKGGATTTVKQNKYQNHCRVAAAKLITHLLNLIRACYDTKRQEEKLDSLTFPRLIDGARFEQISGFKKDKLFSGGDDQKKKRKAQQSSPKTGISSRLRKRGRNSNEDATISPTQSFPHHSTLNSDTETAQIQKPQQPLPKGGISSRTRKRRRNTKTNATIPPPQSLPHHSVLNTDTKTTQMQALEFRSGYSRINSVRADLASETLDLLNKALHLNQKDDQENEESSPLNLLWTWRSALNSHHMDMLVALGWMLHDIIIRPRFSSNSLQKNLSTISDQYDGGFDLHNENEHEGDHSCVPYESHEKMLWTSHLNFSEVIGHGGVRFSEHDLYESTQNRPIVIEQSLRSHLYQSIANGGPRQLQQVGGTINIASRDYKQNKFWPLWLPQPLRVLMTYNLAGEPPLKSMVKHRTDHHVKLQACYPERLIVEGFLSSLSALLEGRQQSELSQPNIEQGDEMCLEDCEALLGADDARIVLAALSRLPGKDQNAFLNSLLNILLHSLEEAATYEQSQQAQVERSILFAQRQGSSFLARLVTVATHAAALQVVASRNCDSYQKLQRQLLFCAVEWSSRSCKEPPKPRPSGDWYCSKTSYMDLFGIYWESSSSDLPAEQSTLKDGKGDNIGAFQWLDKLESVLNQSFIVGFLSARWDSGHLQFAVWNALGKIAKWKQKKTLPIIAAAQLPEKEDDVATLLLQLRDEVCLVHEHLRQLSESKDQVEKRDATSNVIVSSIKETLGAMVQKGATLIKQLLDRYVFKDGNIMDTTDGIGSDIKRLPFPAPIPSTKFFCLAEALAVYTSFSIASHTTLAETGIHDLFSLRCKTLRQHRSQGGSADAHDADDEAEKSSKIGSRARGYSSDSEGIDLMILGGHRHTEDHDDSEAVAADDDEEESIDSEDVWCDCIEELSMQCTSIGAVPGHPDWLDQDCSLRDSISYEDCLRAALQALDSLVQLLAIGINQFLALRRQALIHSQKQGRQNEQAQNVEESAALASNLAMFACNFDSEKSSFFKDELSQERNIEKDILAVCGLHDDAASSAVVALTGGTAYREMSKLRCSAKVRWCPNAAVSVKGGLTNLFRNQIVSGINVPELRAGGEWEILMASTLTAACINQESLPSASEEQHQQPVEITNENRKSEETYISPPASSYSEKTIICSERWRQVSLGVVSALMPVSALLRLGLTRKQRHQHPITLQDLMSEERNTNNSKQKSEPEPSVDNLLSSLPSTISKDRVRSSVHEALACLVAARNTIVPTAVQIKPSEIGAASIISVANNLSDAGSFATLQGMQDVQMILDCQARVVQRVKDNKDKDIVVRAAAHLITRLAAVLETAAYGDRPVVGDASSFCDKSNDGNTAKNNHSFLLESSDRNQSNTIQRQLDMNLRQQPPLFYFSRILAVMGIQGVADIHQHQLAATTLVSTFQNSFDYNQLNSSFLKSWLPPVKLTNIDVCDDSKDDGDGVRDTIIMMTSMISILVDCYPRVSEQKPWCSDKTRSFFCRILCCCLAAATTQQPENLGDDHKRYLGVMDAARQLSLWNDASIVSEEQWATMVRRDVCRISSVLSKPAMSGVQEKEDDCASNDDCNLAPNLCLLLALLLAAGNRKNKKDRKNISSSFTKGGIIFSSLRGSFDCWKNNMNNVSVLHYNTSRRRRRAFLNLLFSYACAYGRLDEIGSIIFAAVSSAVATNSAAVDEADAMCRHQVANLENLATLGYFISEMSRNYSRGQKRGTIKFSFEWYHLLQEDDRLPSLSDMVFPTDQALVSPPTEQQLASIDNCDALSQRELRQNLPRTCSYVTKPGFHEQHWYHCHTCGLTWDKGCCSLCAVLCHSNCDVSYARYSSFFCDCGEHGAEGSAAANDQEINKDRQSLAEQGSNKNSLLPCKCLTPMTIDQVKQAYVSARESMPACMENVINGDEDDQSDGDACLVIPDFSLTARTCRQILELNASSGLTHGTAIEAMLLKCSQQKWLLTLVKIVQAQLQADQTVRCHFFPPNPAQEPADIFATSYRQLRQQHRMTIASVAAANEHSESLAIISCVHRNRHSGFVPLGVIVPASEDSGSNESSNNSPGNCRASKISANLRGRLCLAVGDAGKRIKFCSGLSAANTWWYQREEQPSKTIPSFTAMKMTPTGSHSLSDKKNKIAGLAAGRTIQDRLLVWGLDWCSVLHTNGTGNRVLETIDLYITMSSESIINCHWIPKANDDVVVVGTKRALSVYDLKNDDCKISSSKVAPTSGIRISDREEGGALRDFCVVPICPLGIDNHGTLEDQKEGEPLVAGAAQSETIGCRWKIFMLMESGVVHTVDLERSGSKDVNYDDSLLLVRSTLQEGGSPIDLTAAGIDSTMDSPTNISSSLVYLEQSGMLLYQKDSLSAVYALFVNYQDGCVTNCIELLPEQLLANSNDMVVGWYRNWTDLGVVQRQKDSCDLSCQFRVCCTAQRTSLSNVSNKRHEYTDIQTTPIILVCHFGIREDPPSVHISELDFLPSHFSTCLKQPSDIVVEGLTALSAPSSFQATSKSSTVSANAPVLGERIILCAITNQGAMYMFGETTVVPGQAWQMTGKQVVPYCDKNSSNNPSYLFLSEKSRSFPLTAFEHLTNVMAADMPMLVSEVTFEGDMIGSSEEIREKLMRDTDGCLTSPRRDGFAMLIYLSRRCNINSNNLNAVPRPSSGNIEGSFILALRVLVGCSPTSIPKRLYIQGRPIICQKGTKKWYSLFMTAAEMAAAVRNGFVSFAVDKTFDGISLPVIDAIEVYCADRQKMLYPWLPTSLQSIVSSSPTKTENNSYQNGHSPIARQQVLHLNGNGVHVDMAQSSIRENFLESCRTLILFANLSDISHQEWNAPAGINVPIFLKKLAQETALDRDDRVTFVVDLIMKCFQPDCEIRQSLKDKAILVACKTMLQAIQESLCTAAISGDTDCLSSRWQSLKSTLQDVLHLAAEVATSRPANYLAALEDSDSESNNKQKLSIAVQAGKLFTENLFQRLYMAGIDDRIVSVYVELCLLEMAGSGSPEYAMTRSGTAAGDGSNSTIPLEDTFETLKSLLAVHNQAISHATCTAIYRFCEKHGTSNSKSTDENCGTDIFAAQTMVAFYKCDSCGLFPISDVRYTLLDGENDDNRHQLFDLCRRCFQLGTEYAGNHGFSCKSDVVIQGRTVGEDTTKLSCAEVKRMQPVAIQKAGNTDADTSQVENDSEEEMQLKKGLKLSLAEEQASGTEVVQRQQLFDDFMDRLFSGIVAILANRRNNQAIPTHLLQLAIGLVHLSSGRKFDRAKRLAKELVLSLSSSLTVATTKFEPSGSYDEREKKASLLTAVKLLDDLVLLVVQGNFARSYLSRSRRSSEDAATALDEPNNSNSGIASICCEVHGLPAIRRKCSMDGADKDRLFYCCGLERKSRCNYFVWEDELKEDNSVASGDECRSKSKSQFDEAIAGHVWQLLGIPTEKGELPLHAKLCEFIENCIGYTELRKVLSIPSSSSSHSNESTTETNDCSTTATSQKICNDYELGDNIFAAENDIADGILCSRGRLFDLPQNALYQQGRGHSNLNVDNSISISAQTKLFVEAVLELLALIASPNSENISSWFPLLCEIILCTGKDESANSFAKRTLSQLCGRKRELYLVVRDHNYFGFQFEKLLKHTGCILNSSLLLREKARLCGSSWRASHQGLAWKDLGLGGLFGVIDLVPEDLRTLQVEESAGLILSDLWTLAKKRNNNWRQFCSLSSLPKPRMQSVEDPYTAELHDFSPITVLCWIACVLVGETRLKALRLVDLAFTIQNERKIPGRSNDSSSGDDDTGCKLEAKGERHEKEAGLVSFQGAAPETPSESILSISKDDVYTFVLSFVCHGRTAELRRLACNVAVKMCHLLNPETFGPLFERLIDHALCQAGEMGKNHLELLALLQSITTWARSGSLDVASSALMVKSYWKRQMVAIRQARTNGEYLHFETRSAHSIHRRRFDLASCVHCHGAQKPISKLGKSGSSSNRTSPTSNSSTNRRSRSSSSPATSRTAKNVPWLYEQVSPATRVRLDAGREVSASNEFSSFFTLKHRLVLSEVHVEVSNPRGRYVKTITVYFSSRPVDGVNALKSEDFVEMWQPCATLNLSRGATSASCNLKKPVVAANIKIEYTDFFERPGGSKAPDGTLLVHCPRCTRVVTNAHGVCGNCGEVAFQCRKCRHINYDRLDAFLCVECGYCASGTFSFQLTAGIASNAVAITNNRDDQRATQMLVVASRLHEDLKRTLRERLSILVRGGKKQSSGDDGALSAALKRAFGGFPPLQVGLPDDAVSLSLDKLGRQGTVVRVVARPESSVTSSSRDGASAGLGSETKGERNRSLLRLIRPSSSDRRRSSDNMIIRDVGRDFHVDDEDETDLVGLLEGTGALARAAGLDASESLNRLLASVQSQREHSSAATGTNEELDSARKWGGGGDDDNSTRNRGTTNVSKMKTQSTKENMNVCDKLYILMREAERESYEIQRKILAWHRLEHGVLSEVAFNQTPAATGFVPSHCSACAGAIATQLLMLWLRLFKIDPCSVAITKEMITLLLSDDVMLPKSLQDTKRAAVKDIALLSQQGAEIVLNALRSRLIASRDLKCAEILGEIIEAVNDDNSSSSREPFVALAMEVLETAHDSG